MENIIKLLNLNIPVICLFASDYDMFRKPMPGACAFINSQIIPLIICKDVKKRLCLTNSYYVGDAAGRMKNKLIKKSDHSNVDALMALNSNIKFYTPESYFSEYNTKISYPNPKQFPVMIPVMGVDMDSIFRKTIPAPLRIPNESILSLKDSMKTPCIVLMVGSPGSGKSRLARWFAMNDEVTVLNQDELKTLAKVKNGIKQWNKQDMLILDRTHGTKVERAKIIDMCKDTGISDIYCISFELSKQVVMRSNTYRTLIPTKESRSTGAVPDVVIHTYFKNYEKPSTDEGFTDVFSMTAPISLVKTDEPELDEVERAVNDLYYSILL